MSTENGAVQAISLANKYRAKTLDDVVGNEHAVTLLKGWFEKKTVPPAVMLIGEYGMGKTTFARMLARYINCDTQTACGTCRNCKAMDSDTCTDYVEKNIGVEGGKEDIISLINQVNYMPRASLRIFTLDEIHAASKQAKDALLKTLEEPPKRSMFILATNNPDKVIDTIQSRCVKIKLTAPEPEQIVRRLAIISKLEGFPISKKDEEKVAILYEIARISRGHMRDALQMLQSYLSVAASGEEFDLKQLIKDYFGTDEAQLEKIAYEILLASAEGNTRQVIVNCIKMKEEVRPVVYKMRYLIDNIIASLVKMAKYTMPSTNLFLKNSSANIGFLNSVQTTLTELEQTFNTVPGLTERIAFQTAMANIALYRAKSRKES